jgi:hypothetical protein
MELVSIQSYYREAGYVPELELVAEDHREPSASDPLSRS